MLRPIFFSKANLLILSTPDRTLYVMKQKCAIRHCPYGISLIPTFAGPLLASAQEVPPSQKRHLLFASQDQLLLEEQAADITRHSC
jgi:hypothetical protein